MKVIMKTNDCYRFRSRLHSSPYQRSITDSFETGYSRSSCGDRSFNSIQMSMSLSWINRSGGSRCG